MSCDYIRLSSLPAAGEVRETLEAGALEVAIYNYHMIIMIIGYQYSCDFNENRCAKISLKRENTINITYWSTIVFSQRIQKFVRLLHFSFRNVCPACILAPFLIPDSFVATPHSISCLYTKKKLNLFFLIRTKPSNPFPKKRKIPIVEYPFDSRYPTTSSQRRLPPLPLIPKATRLLGTRRCLSALGHFRI